MPAPAVSARERRVEAWGPLAEGGAAIASNAPPCGTNKKATASPGDSPSIRELDAELDATSRSWSSDH